jgi:hypothetical protein
MRARCGYLDTTILFGFPPVAVRQLQLTLSIPQAGGPSASNRAPSPRLRLARCIGVVGIAGAAVEAAGATGLWDDKRRVDRRDSRLRNDVAC